jgi:hypothetical protein
MGVRRTDVAQRHDDTHDGEGDDTVQRLITLIAVLAIALAACGSPDDGVASLDDATADDLAGQQQQAEGVDDEQALLAFAACMRDNGVEGFPDPRLDADGSVDFGASSGDPFAGVDNDTAEAAVNACIGELEGLAFAPGGSDFDLTEIQDALVEFAQCMRDNGIDFDDPDLRSLVLGDGDLSNPFGELDLSDPDVAAAVERCQDVFTGIGPGFGG